MKKFSLKNRILLAGGIATAAIAAIVSSTLAWFAPDRITDIALPSGVVVNYFDSRDGASGVAGSTTNPFVITKPEHLFNLMWLQHSNKDVTDPVGGATVKFKEAHFNFEFGKAFGNNGIKQFYAYDDYGVAIKNTDGTPKYSSYLNMKYYSTEKVLIPIGSEADPFKAALNGNNLTVKNIDIYNTYDRGQMDVGIFGFVDDAARISNAYFENVNINVGAPNYTAVDHGTRSEPHNYINVGYIAGHAEDADASFEDVYVNNAKFENTDEIDKVTKNHFGYFGHVDANEIQEGTGTNQSVQLTPESAKAMFDSKSSKLFPSDSTKSPTFEVRNSHVGKTGKFNDHFSTSEGTYSGSDNYSLATAGYSTDTEYVKYASYGSTPDGTQNRLDVGTQIVSKDQVDNEAYKNLDEGWYAYYDSTNTKWQYAHVNSNEGEVTEVNFNCYMISFTDGGQKYYLRNNNGSLQVTSATPNASDQDSYADYYFAFKDTSTSKGVTTLSSLSSSTAYKLFSPKYDSYIKAPLSGTASTFSFTSSFSEALPIKITQNITRLIALDGSGNETTYQFLATSSGCYLKNVVAGLPGNLFTLEGGSTSTQKQYSNSYSKISSVSDLAPDGEGHYPVIAFLYNYPGKNNSDEAKGYYAMSSQAKNNRQVERVTVTTEAGNSVVSADNALGKAISNFQVGTTEISNTTYYTFQDVSSELYLYAAGTSSTGSNYLRSQESITSNHWAEWSLTTSGTGFVIESKGNRNVPYINFLDGTTNTGRYQIFRCSNSSSNSGGTGKIEIYKLMQNETASITISHSFVYTARSISEGTKTLTGPYNIYYSDNAAFSTNTTLLNIEQVTFNFVASQVTFTATASDVYELVQSTAGLSVNDEIVFVYDTLTFGSMSSSKLSAISGSTFTTNNTRITELASGTQVYTVTAGSQSGTVAFKYSDSTTYLRNYSTKNSSTANLTTQNSVDDYTSWTVTISSGEATIENYSAIDANEHNRHLRVNTSTSPKVIKGYLTSTADTTTVKIFKRVPAQSIEAQTTYIGDIIGNTYDPNVIDVTGAVTYSSTSIAVPSTNHASIPASSTVGATFYATKMKDSVVIYVRNSGSGDLGNLTFEFTSTGTNPAYFSRGAGDGTPLESISGNRAEDNNHYSYSIPINSGNISSIAYCALGTYSGENTNMNRSVYGYYYNDNGTIKTSPSSFTTSSIGTYVLVIAGTAAMNITNIKYEFTQLPGNTGNFGKVGYRSAAYLASGAFDSEATDTKTNYTILNYYINVPVSTLSSISVTYNVVTDDQGHVVDRIYQITVYLSTSTNMNIFNYDSTNYTVRANETLLSGNSTKYMVPASAYDAETGWSATP